MTTTERYVIHFTATQTPALRRFLSQGQGWASRVGIYVQDDGSFLTNASLEPAKADEDEAIAEAVNQEHPHLFESVTPLGAYSHADIDAGAVQSP